jgi:hypothetical protein
MTYYRSHISGKQPAKPTNLQIQWYYITALGDAVSFYHQAPAEVKSAADYATLQWLTWYFSTIDKHLEQSTIKVRVGNLALK